MAVSNLVSASAGKVLKVARFTTPGVSTFTLPAGYDATNPLTAEITVVGGGGSAGRGHYQSGSDFGVGGGGGGGGVLTQTVQFTQNMTVGVGRGGASPNWYWYNGTSYGQGYNGGCSFVGSAQPVNLFLNPRFRGIWSSEVITQTPFGPGFTDTSTSYGNPGVGSTLALYNSSFTSYTYHYGPTFDVIPSTNYCFSMYNYSPGGTMTYQTHLTWLQSDGTFISNNSINHSLSASTWTRIQNGATAPANAAYCRIMIQRTGGTGSLLAINSPMFESGTTTASTYVDGDTAGYRYAGNPYGSVTVANTANIFVAGGGGGGNGYGTDRGYATRHARGFAGASSGGGAWYESSVGAQWAMYGGHGGGAGGSATPLTHVFDSDSGSTAYQASWSRRGYETTGKFSDNGEGTLGNYFSVIANYSQMYTGSPGPGRDGYGKGGFGAYTSNNQGQSTSANTEAELLSSLAGVNNTGNGGNAAVARLQNTGTVNSYGGAGGSGLVIIKYWE